MASGCLEFRVCRTMMIEEKSVDIKTDFQILFSRL
jgi:hypothetical protein